MSFGDAVSEALTELRAYAESLMWDSCVITDTTTGGWNEGSGQYDEATTTTVYSGPCRLRMPRTDGSRVEAGEASWAVDDGVLSLPVDGSEGVAAGHVAVVSLGRDPVGSVTATVQATHVQSASTARRLPVKVVARDA